MYQVLTGENYTEARLYGIIAEMFYSQVGRLPKQNDITTMLTGYVTKNTITDDVGYIIDSDCQYFDTLPLIHICRLDEIEEGDGWRDSANVDKIK